MGKWRCDAADLVACEKLTFEKNKYMVCYQNEEVIMPNHPAHLQKTLCIEENLEYRFDMTSYLLIYIHNTESYLYKKNSLKMAKKVNRESCFLNSSDFIMVALINSTNSAFTFSLSLNHIIIALLLPTSTLTIPLTLQSQKELALKRTNRFNDWMKPWKRTHLTADLCKKASDWMTGKQHHTFRKVIDTQVIKMGVKLDSTPYREYYKYLVSTRNTKVVSITCH